MKLEHWDSHLHSHPFKPDWWAERLIANMDRNNVRVGAISGVALFNAKDNEAVPALAERYPGRLLPMLSFIDLNNPAELDRAIAELATGRWAGVGELFFEAHTSPHLSFDDTSGQMVRLPYPVPKDGARNRVLGGLIRYCAEHDLPILIHSESAAALEELLVRYPHTSIIWAHCDYVTPLADVRRIFRSYPWLMVDFGPMIRCGYWDTQQGPSAWLQTDLPFWRELCMDFPDRLLLGTDTLGDKYTAPERYRHIYDSYTDFLEPVGVARAQKIVAGNFKRCFHRYLSRHPEFGQI